MKLPVLYLMDSIVKNHPEQYKKLFARNLVDTFVHVFAKSNERTRSLLFKLRMTWNDYFLASTLAELDHSVKKIDPAWPIATPRAQTNNIHINPAVFARQTSAVSFFIYFHLSLCHFPDITDYLYWSVKVLTRTNKRFDELIINDRLNFLLKLNCSSYFLQVVYLSNKPFQLKKYCFQLCLTS